MVYVPALACLTTWCMFLLAVHPQGPKVTRCLIPCIDCRNGTLSHRVVAEADNGQPSITDKQDDQYVRDVRTAFAGVPKLRPQWVDKYMTILVVGESGLGEPSCLSLSWQINILAE